MGGFDLVIVRTEPPVLQIRICLVTVAPATTFPKWMALGTLLSQPFSLVETAIEAIAGLPAEAASITVSTPPSDQTVTLMAKEPVDVVLKNRGIPMLWPGARVWPGTTN
jgi:hypothetical protein